MGLFSGLEKFGFKMTEQMDVYEKPNMENKKEEVQVQKEIIKEEDCIFPKSFACPICEETFKAFSVKTGKIRCKGQDYDLRPIYNEMDPIKYDAIVCPYCGYAALSRFFPQVMPLQAKKLRAELKKDSISVEFGKQKYSFDDAIVRYKMALYSDVIGGVKNSRKAYTCLKMAWVIRGKIEREGAFLSEEERNNLKAEEQECLKSAYEGYRLAISSETFPMSGMDEITVMYLIAELAFQFGDYQDALMFVSRIVSNPKIPGRIKDKGMDLKERIRCKMKEEQ